jgi:heparan-alpha-glucosaminide N-acetyltransferase
MKSTDRFVSIDIMRGLTLLLMLFVNDLNMRVAPAWLGHMQANFDGMGLADWVFPGFLFIVGMTIPFAMSNRFAKGEKPSKISLHIIIRTISLLIIGVLMLNSGRVNPELTGMKKNLWALLMYIAVFLIWNDYPRSRGKYLFTVMKLIGAAALIVLAVIFRSDEAENAGWLITGWWGILGLIGWGYLITAFTYLIFRDSIPATAGAVLFFLLVNMLDGWGLLGFLDPVRPVLGIIIEGNVPLIVLTGLLAGVIIRKLRAAGTQSVIMTFLTLGIISLAIGFILRNWFIISKIQATPSWGMICSGISFIVFTIIYWLADVKGWKKWAAFVKPAGQHSLTTYLAPDILYYVIWMTGVPVLIYKQSSEPLVVVIGSIAWALLMAGLTALLAKINIKLKL